MVAVLSCAVGAAVKLRIVKLQPEQSLPFSIVGRDHSGDSYQLAKQDAQKDNLLDNLDIR